MGISFILTCVDENDDQKIKSQVIALNAKLNMEKWQKKIIELNDIFLYEDTFFKEENRKIKYEIMDLIHEIKNTNIKQLNSKEYLEKLSKYNDIIKISKEKLKLNESLLFKEIYNKNIHNYSDKNILLEYCINTFNKIIKILEKKELNVENDNDNILNIKYLCDIYYQNENNLNKEIEWIYKYFNKENSTFKNKFLMQIKIISKKKILLSLFSGIIILFEDISNDNLNNNEKEILNQIKQHKNDLEKNENLSMENIQEKINYLNIKINIDFNPKEKNKILYEILSLINNFPKSVEFIRNKKINQLKNLVYFWLDSNDSGLFAKEINHFINIVEFFEKIISQYENKEKTFLEIIKLILNNFLDDNQFALIFKEYINNYKNIQFLFDKYLKPTEGCIKKIKYILGKSIFYISLNKEIKKYEIQGQYELKEIDLDLKYNKNDENNNIINDIKNDYSDIKILEEFSKIIFLDYKELEIIEQKLLISKIKVEEEKKIIDIYLLFLNQIKELLDILNDLYSNGYPEDINIKIIIQKANIICPFKENMLDIKTLLLYFKNIKNAIKSSWKIIYLKKSSLMNLFYGRQIYFLYNNIKNKNEFKNYNLFKALSNSKIKELIINDSLFNNKNLNYDLIINDFDLYLNDLVKCNNTSIEDIYKENKIIEQYNKYTGIYFYISEDQDIDSLFIYQKFTNKLPINACFLYCTPDTTSEEIVVKVIFYFV